LQAEIEALRRGRVRVLVVGFFFGPCKRFDGHGTGVLDAPVIRSAAILDRMIDWTASRRGDAWLVALQLLVRAASDPPIAAVFQKRYAQFRRRLAKLLESGAQGVIRADIPADLLADQISAMGDGWAMMFPVEPERFGRGRIHDLVTAAIVMLTPQPR
jgi:TetR/AcrR family transcriptional regulator, transcriptional repressor of aconitase